jgi:peptidylprolyl isomerase
LLRTRALRCLLASAIATAIATGALTVSASAQTGQSQTGHAMTTPSGLQIIDTQVGTGAVPTSGQTVAVDYTGWLYVDGKKGAKFDSSLDRGQPISFPLGEGRVIKGWDEGISTMHVGGKRTLIIPPDLAYGDRGAGGVIPPGATLLFEVTLVSAN